MPRMFPPLNVLENEGVMKLRSRGDVQRTTGEGACHETVLVVDEVGNNHFDDFLGNGRCNGDPLCDGGSASVPNLPDENQVAKIRVTSE